MLIKFIYKHTCIYFRINLIPKNSIEAHMIPCESEPPPEL